MTTGFREMRIDSYLGHYCTLDPSHTPSTLLECLKKHIPDISENQVAFHLSTRKILQKQTKQAVSFSKQVCLYKKLMLKKRVHNLTIAPFFEQGTKEWLKEREGLISASDCGAALGYDAYTTPKQLLLKKCGLGKPFTGNKFTEHGHKYEDVAAQLYQTKNLKPLHFFGLIKHKNPSIPIGASPDGIREDGVMLEIKVPYSRVPNGIVPPHYEIQTQVQMEVCDLYENDFYECSISEYNSGMEYEVDGSDRHASDGCIKGILGEWYHVTTGSTLHKYPPIWCTTKESKQWIESKNNELKKTNPDYRFGCIIYWKLVLESNVRVTRNKKKMYEEQVPVFKKSWKEILYHRSNEGKELLFNKPPCDIQKNEKHVSTPNSQINTEIAECVFQDDSDSD
jgi:putative phage-type endonuclease